MLRSCPGSALRPVLTSGCLLKAVSSAPPSLRSSLPLLLCPAIARCRSACAEPCWPCRGMRLQELLLGPREALPHSCVCERASGTRVSLPVLRVLYANKWVRCSPLPAPGPGAVSPQPCLLPASQITPSGHGRPWAAAGTQRPPFKERAEQQPNAPLFLQPPLGAAAGSRGSCSPAFRWGRGPRLGFCKAESGGAEL